MKLLKLDRRAFEKRFGTKQFCYPILAELKWGNSYTCRNYNNIEHIKANNHLAVDAQNVAMMNLRQPLHSSTNIKFDIDKAFGMLYEISTNKKGASSISLSKQFGVQQNTT